MHSELQASNHETLYIEPYTRKPNLKPWNVQGPLSNPNIEFIGAIQEFRVGCGRLRQQPPCPKSQKEPLEEILKDLESRPELGIDLGFKFSCPLTV